jgi:RibD C-terminal domain
MCILLATGLAATINQSASRPARTYRIVTAVLVAMSLPDFNGEMGAAVGALMGDSEATPLGRQTYDEFAAYWPNADPNDPLTAVMNGARKYVVSNWLADATWEKSTIVRGDVSAELLKLKHDTGLSTTGSATLIRWMVERGLVDELHP